MVYIKKMVDKEVRSLHSLPSTQPEDHLCAQNAMMPEHRSNQNTCAWLEKASL